MRGGQGHLLILMVSITVAIPLGLIMAAWLMIGLKRDAEVPVRLETLFRGCVIAVGCLLLSIASASAMRWIKVREARDYVASLGTRLDEYRSKHGRYPSSLGEVQAPNLPSLLAYSGEGNGYCFEYREPFFLSAGRLFDSRSRRWLRLDS